MKPTSQITHKLHQSASYLGETFRSTNTHASFSKMTYSSTRTLPPKPVSSPVPAPLKPREPLGQISTNVSATSTNNQDKTIYRSCTREIQTTPAKCDFSLGVHLGFYGLVERYAVPQRASLADLTYHPAWRSWLEQLASASPISECLDYKSRLWF
jgi:hypothetical protein